MSQNSYLGFRAGVIFRKQNKNLMFIEVLAKVNET